MVHATGIFGLLGSSVFALAVLRLTVFFPKALLVEKPLRPNQDDNTGDSNAPAYFRDALHGAWDSLPAAPTTRKEESKTQNQVFANLMRPRRSVAEDDVVMVTHTSLGSRLSNILVQLRWWNGPAALGVYIHSKADIDRFLNVLVPELLQPNTTAFDQLQVHVFMENTTLPYPHNHMRNLVMDHLRSDYFVAMDADFITSPNAHQGLSSLVKSSGEVRKRLRQQHLFVLPAFELKAPKGLDSPSEEMLPRTKQKLLELKRQKQITTFHPDWEYGHGPTNFSRWESEENTSTDNKHRKVYYPIQYGRTFEPYVLGYRHGVPRYWKGFRGYKYNKVSWFEEMNRAGFSFCTLMDFYVVHLNHPVHRDKSFKGGNNRQYSNFQQYTVERYPKLPQPSESDAKKEEKR